MFLRTIYFKSIRTCQSELVVSKSRLWACAEGHQLKLVYLYKLHCRMNCLMLHKNKLSQLQWYYTSHQFFFVFRMLHSYMYIRKTRNFFRHLFGDRFTAARTTQIFFKDNLLHSNRPAHCAFSLCNELIAARFKRGKIVHIIALL